MSLLWLILKIILWILLIIIGVIVLLIVLLLTLPIDYSGEFKKINEIVFKAKVRIFYIATVQFGYTEENSDFIIKVFGRQINKSTTHVEQEEVKQEVKGEIKKEIKQDIKQETRQEEMKSSPKEKKDSGIETSGAISSRKQENERTKKASKEEKSIRKKVEKDKSNNFRETWGNIKILWRDEYRKGFTRGVKRLIVGLCRELKPDSIYFNLLIGRENPADTGELLALITLLYPLYGRYGVVQADFEEEGIWGEVRARGRLRLYRLIKPFVIFVLNKSVRNYVKIILNIRKDDSNGVSIK